MTANIDWEKVEKENTVKYKDYAPEGVHKTKVAEVELQEAKTGSKGIRFILADNDEYAFPKYGAVAWLSSKNPGWRQHHMKELFVVLGTTEANARKLVEQCEEGDDLAKAYLAMFNKVLPKAKEVEVDVFYRNKDDQYTTWDFASSKVRMTKPEKEESKTPIEEASEEIDLSDVPF